MCNCGEVWVQGRPESLRDGTVPNHFQAPVHGMVQPSELAIQAFEPCRPGLMINIWSIMA